MGKHDKRASAKTILHATPVQFISEFMSPYVGNVTIRHREGPVDTEDTESAQK